MNNFHSIIAHLGGNCNIMPMETENLGIFFVKIECIEFYIFFRIHPFEYIKKNRNHVTIFLWWAGIWIATSRVVKTVHWTVFVFVLWQP